MGQPRRERAVAAIGDQVQLFLPDGTEQRHDLLFHCVIAALAPIHAHPVAVGLADLAAQVDEALGEHLPNDLRLLGLKRQLHGGPSCHRNGAWLCGAYFGRPLLTGAYFTLPSSNCRSTIPSITMCSRCESVSEIAARCIQGLNSSKLPVTHLTWAAIS